MAIPSPSYASEELTAGQTVSSPVSTGVYFRRPFFVPLRNTLTHYPKRWRLVYLPGQLNPTTALELFIAWNTARGGAGQYDSFVPPWDSSLTIPVRFVDDELTFDVASLVAFGCSLTIEETVDVA